MVLSVYLLLLFGVLVKFMFYSAFLTIDEVMEE